MIEIFFYLIFNPFLFFQQKNHGPPKNYSNFPPFTQPNFAKESCFFGIFQWISTSQKTLGTLNHGLESLLYCFITLVGLKSSLVPPGALWRLPGLPGAPLTPGMLS